MSLGDRIKAARLAKGLSQADLGRLAGMSQQAIMMLEAGTTKRTGRLPEIAEALGTTAEALTGAERSSPAALPVPSAHSINFRELPKDVPVLGQVVGGDNGDFRFNGQTIDYLRRPPGLANARDVFGLYVTGTSMWPKFEEGEPIYVSGARPPAIGDYVVIELYPMSDGEQPEGYIKRLKKRTPTKIVCEQFNPPKDVEYDRDTVRSVLRVIPLVELVGI